MKNNRYIAIGVLFLFTACGGGSSNQNIENSLLPNQNIVQRAKDLTLTIYIDGFSKEGYKRIGTFGENNTLLKYKDIIEAVGLTVLDEESTSSGGNLLVGTNYYGDTVPEYYSDKDKEELETITKRYEGGIPRYAFIVAKYTEHIMKERGATKVNFVSASMGSLIVRWIIEKNLLELASNKRIEKWYSLEGVLKGNYAASKVSVDTLSGLLEGKSPEITQMSYDWVNSHFNNSSSYYKDIQVGYESSTRDDLENGFLTKYLFLQDKFYPNDGYQLVKDTYLNIGEDSVHNYFHENHKSIEANKAAWSMVSNFILSKSRIKIKLLKATVTDIHEADKKRTFLGFISFGTKRYKPAEIVFASKVISPKLYDKLGSDNAIDNRAVDGGTLPIYNYSNNGDTLEINQTLFNGFVDATEESLTLKIHAYELDNDLKYNVHESLSTSREDLGEGSIDIPLKDGIYTVTAADWEGQVKVERVDY